MIRLVAVGKIKNAPLRDAAADYLARIGRFARMEVLEIGDSNPTTEAKLMLATARGRPRIVCDERGETWTSRELAEFLGQHGSPCFFMGGPDGFDDQVEKECDRALRLSSFTLPHELARVVLLEQIYRGLSILKGHPYHRD